MQLRWPLVGALLVACAAHAQLNGVIDIHAHSDPDSVAFRALQKHSCQTEQWVGSVSLLDLLDDLGKGAFLWQEVNLNSGGFDLLKYLFIPSQIGLVTPK